jgi:hypothetical protein
VSRFLAINIEGKIGQLTVRRTSSFNMRQATCLMDEVMNKVKDYISCVLYTTDNVNEKE